MPRVCALVLCLALVLVLVLGPADAVAQKSVAGVFGLPNAAEGQPKSYLEELMRSATSRTAT